EQNAVDDTPPAPEANPRGNARRRPLPGADPEDLDGLRQFLERRGRPLPAGDEQPSLARLDGGDPRALSERLRPERDPATGRRGDLHQAGRLRRVWLHEVTRRRL